MAKYLIQDIIPAEKKHRAARKKAHPAAHNDEGIHDVVSHIGGAEEASVPHEVITEANQLMHSKPKEIIPENPRMILEEHIHEEEVAHSEEDTENETLSANSVLPSDEHTSDTVITRNIETPHFPEYKSGDGFFNKENSHWLPWILGVGAIGVLVVFILNFFGGATITVVPKHDAIPMDQEMTALKNPQGGELPYAIMKVTLSDTQEVPATGTKTVTEKASGQIIVYNKQTTAQRLIRNTRFQSPDGKIYRINESINVPKSTTKNGQVTPGSITVTVYADEAGPAYNIEPTDFTIPGLKGTPQFDKVYARSKGPITGGASGTLKTVSDQDLKQAADELRIALETKLRTKARADLAATQISFDNGLIVDLEDATLSKEPASSDDKALVTEEGTIYVVAFDRTQLSKAIEKALIPTYAGEEVAIKNLDSLSFSMQEKDGENLWSQDKLTFSLAGTPQLTWSIDQDVIIKSLLGSSKDAFNETLAKYPTVERAKATLRPFWKSKFPEDASKITIKIVDAIDENTPNTPTNISPSN